MSESLEQPGAAKADDLEMASSPEKLSTAELLRMARLKTAGLPDATQPMTFSRSFPGVTLALIAGGGIPAVAYFAGDLIDALSAPDEQLASEVNKAIVAIELIAIGACLVAGAAWSQFDTHSAK